MIFVHRNCWFLSNKKVYAYQKLDSKLKMLYFEALFKKKKNNLNSKLNSLYGMMENLIIFFMKTSNKYYKMTQ